MARNRNDRDIVFEIHAHLGVISEASSGWKKELNLVAWNDGKPKFDIRDWDEAHEHMSRGVTLREEEAVRLMEILQENLGAHPKDAAVGGESAEA